MILPIQLPVQNSNPEGINQYSSSGYVKKEQVLGSHKEHVWEHPVTGDKVRLSTETIHSKIKNLRDPSKQKNVAVVDIFDKNAGQYSSNWKEHKAFSTKGDSEEAKQKLSDQVEKHLKKSFDIDHKIRS